MIEEEKLKMYRLAIGLTNTLLMFGTVVLQIVDFSAIRHIILCSVIILLATVTLICDGFLENHKSMISQGVLSSLCLFSLLLAVFRI